MKIFFLSTSSVNCIWKSNLPITRKIPALRSEYSLLHFSFFLSSSRCKYSFYLFRRLFRSRLILVHNTLSLNIYQYCFSQFFCAHFPLLSFLSCYLRSYVGNSKINLRLVGQRNALSQRQSASAVVTSNVCYRWTTTLIYFRCVV
jgi:hypothetical protein